MYSSTRTPRTCMSVRNWLASISSPRSLTQDVALTRVLAPMAFSISASRMACNCASAGARADPCASAGKRVGTACTPADAGAGAAAGTGPWPLSCAATGADHTVLNKAVVKATRFRRPVPPPSAARVPVASPAPQEALCMVVLSISACAKPLGSSTAPAGRAPPLDPRTASFRRCRRPRG